MLLVPLDIKFENQLIKNYAKEVYEDFLSHANKRQLDTAYTVVEILKELQRLEREDRYIK